MTTHSSIPAWRIPWTEEPGGLQPMGSQSRTRPSDSHTEPCLSWDTFPKNTDSPSLPLLQLIDI